MKFPRLRPVDLPRPQRRLLTAAGLMAILGAGFILRLFLSPAPGYEFDVGVNQGWGRSAVELGLARSYDEQLNGNMLPNYAPFSIMLFAAAASVQKLAFGFDANPLTYRILIKLPAILADLLTALCFFFLLKKWKGTKSGMIGAAIYTFHPAVFHESAIWGQTDSIFTMFLALGAWQFSIKRPMIAGMLFALALLTKMQAVFLMPFMFVLYLRGGWRMLLRGVIGGFIATIPVLLPFAIGGTLDTVINVYTGSVGFYSIVSSAAYNFWWSVYADKAGNLQDTSLLFGLMSYRQIGLLLFGLSYLYAFFAFWKHLKPGRIAEMKLLPVLFAAGAFLSLAFFLWNTQMHERYLFPFVALGLPMVFIDRKGALIYFFVSILFYLNLLGWLPAGSVDRGLYLEFPSLDVFVAAAQVIFFFHLAHYLWTLREKFPAPGAKSSVKLLQRLRGIIPSAKPN
jgi:dolichyl-phosphate-mannose-protein mannosyltransferase